MSIENDQSTRQTTWHLAAGLVGIGFAVVYVVRVFLAPWPPACLLMPLTLLALLYGGVSVLCGLILKVNRERRRLWKHLGVFLSIAFLFVLVVGPCNFFGIVDLRLRADVARTGGQDHLRTWALDLLEKSRDQMSEHDSTWLVSKEYWSEQVRRLRPKVVRVQMMFENNQRGVCLCYGGGFLSYTLVIGPPGSQPHRNLNDPDRDSFWIRWRDGVYNWIQG